MPELWVDNNNNNDEHCNASNYHYGRVGNEQYNQLNAQQKEIVDRVMRVFTTIN